jgi:hypothetical protein
LLHTASHSNLTQIVTTSLLDAFRRAESDRDPFPHWILHNVLPAGATKVLRALPFAPADLHGVSGKREFHNDQRHYFDAKTNARFELCGAIADAFQSPQVVRALGDMVGSDLSGAYVRLEYAQDTDGFWLNPHTDLGVKRLTLLIYLSESVDQADLGTDIYRDPETWAKRPRFEDNAALMFVPGANTWHGMERRRIPGVRRSVIMNYVTDDWRAREQLAYPDTPVRA